MKWNNLGVAKLSYSEQIELVNDFLNEVFPIEIIKQAANKKLTDFPEDKVLRLKLAVIKSLKESTKHGLKTVFYDKFQSGSEQFIDTLIITYIILKEKIETRGLFPRSIDTSSEFGRLILLDAI